MPRTAKQSLSREVLRKKSQTETDAVKKELIALKIQYSIYFKLLTGYLKQIQGKKIIHPNLLPTQASFRWSVFNPPITNWPRSCINPSCPQEDHESTENCWSVRDILTVKSDEVLFTWDHDDIEGRIHALIVNDDIALDAYRQSHDLHTIMCCRIFRYPFPKDKVNPHSSEIDKEWRAQVKWQGKDTTQRVLAKNMAHGSKYSRTYRFVNVIPNTERFGLKKKDLEIIAKEYIKSKGESWHRKLEIMDEIQRARIARTLQGARRLFYTSNPETGREGFSHMISGTASLYNNETLITLQRELGDSFRLIHNAHDGDKIAIKKDNYPGKEWLKSKIERFLAHEGQKVLLTASVKEYL